MAQERPGQTLQATALVHETYFRLANVDFTVTMQGITIQNGEAMTGSLGVGDGGDVRVYRGHLLATDCMFSGNAAFLEGSGLFIESSTAVLTGCTLAGNSSPQGGGFSNLLATATLTGCTLSGNSAPDGGGMFNQGTATLVSDTFSGNSASFEGGGLFNFGTAALTDCTLSGNFALDGGGIASDVGGTLIVSGSNFSNNSASTGYGGAIITASTTALTQTTFTANSAGNQGGAIWNGFGRTLTAQATVTLTNTIVADKAASQFRHRRRLGRTGRLRLAGPQPQQRYLRQPHPVRRLAERQSAAVAARQLRRADADAGPAARPSTPAPPPALRRRTSAASVDSAAWTSAPSSRRASP